MSTALCLVIQFQVINQCVYVLLQVWSDTHYDSWDSIMTIPQLIGMYLHLSNSGSSTLWNETFWLRPISVVLYTVYYNLPAYNSDQSYTYERRNIEHNIIWYTNVEGPCNNVPYNLYCKRIFKYERNNIIISAKVSTLCPKIRTLIFQSGACF